MVVTQSPMRQLELVREAKVFDGEEGRHGGHAVTDAAA